MGVDTLISDQSRLREARSRVVGCGGSDRDVGEEAAGAIIMLRDFRPTAQAMCINPRLERKRRHSYNWKMYQINKLFKNNMREGRSRWILS